MNSLDKTTAALLARDLAISLRPRMVILSWIIYSCVITANNGVDIRSIGLGLILFIATYGIVALQNDLSDIETDKINRRQDVPYWTGSLSEVQLVRMMLFLSIIATLSGLALSYHVLLWVSLYIALGFLYSGPLNIKSRGIYAATLLGFCYGAMPWLIGGSVAAQLNQTSLLSMAVISFIFSSGVIVIKDFKDITGDRATHKNTLLVSKGPAYTRHYYLFVTSLAYVLLAIYSLAVNSNALSVVVIAATGLLNFWLLASKTILISPAARSIRGKWARATFFTCALVVYCVNVPTI